MPSSPQVPSVRSGRDREVPSSDCGRDHSCLQPHSRRLIQTKKGDDMGNNEHRLAFLVVEVEPGQALSTRKLLLESAKHNVMTAHTGGEGIEMLRRFPKVDAIAIDVGLKDMECSRIAKEMKSIT